jgi:carboxyl-terminal processing protease
MIKPTKAYQYALVFFLLGSITVACQKDEVEPEVAKKPVEVSLTAETNSWIYDVMDEVYYWSDQMPGDPDKEQDPKDFYKGLLSSEDRFSHIVPNYQDLINSLNGVSKEAGYEFGLFQEENSDNVFAAVLYVKSNSPAAAAGLKRGDEINKINGKQITVSNYKTLVPEIYSDHTIDYHRFNKETGSDELQPQISLQAVELAENPSHLDTVITVGGKKVGYFVYNFFAAGANGSYDKEVDQVMAGFKSEGVSDLVLDLRYNSGGSVASATNLASLLGKNIDGTKIFFENRWNNVLQEYWENEADGEKRLRQHFIDKAEKIGENLSASRLYVLTGQGTASASELIINGLKPYMEVYLIGDKTVGKNVASIPFEDKDNPDNTYGILPIVLRIYNSQGESDYQNGFEPDFPVRDYQFPLKALGDVEEPLLAQALAHITGSNARISSPDSQSQLKPIMSSIELQSRAGRLIMDKPEGLR